MKPLLPPAEYVAEVDSSGEKVFAEFLPGAKMCWRRFGEGPPLVLLHGGHGSWLHWIHNIDSLSKHFALWVPDMAGFGESDTPPAGFGVKEMAAAVNTSLSSILGADTSVALAGFSFGGMIGTQLAQFRQSVRRLATIGVGGHGSERRQTLPMVKWRGLPQEEETVALKQNLASLMLSAVSPNDDLALHIHRGSCYQTRFRSRDLSRQAPLLPLMNNLRLPILFIWGSEDVTAFPQVLGAKLIHGHQERSLAIVPGVGHWAQFEGPENINTLLRRWFDFGESGKAQAPM